MNFQGSHMKLDFKQFERKMSRGNLAKGQFAMANQMLADMNNYVPRANNFLRSTGHTSAGGDELIWRTVYALAQFHGSRPVRRGMPVSVFMRNYTTPGTGKRWDLAAKKSPKHVASWRKAYVKGAGLN